MDIYEAYEIEGKKFMDEIEWLVPLKTTVDPNATPHKHLIGKEKDLSEHQLLCVKWDQINFYIEKSEEYSNKINEAMQSLTPELKTEIKKKLSILGIPKRPKLQEPMEEEEVSMIEARNRLSFAKNTRAKKEDQMVNCVEENNDQEDDNTQDKDDIDLLFDDKSPLPHEGNLFDIFEDQNVEAAIDTAIIPEIANNYNEDKSDLEEEKMIESKMDNTEMKNEEFYTVFGEMKNRRGHDVFVKYLSRKEKECQYANDFH
jgi:hypothetical protein